MSHTRNIRFIAKITNVDIEGSTGLVCLGIVDQQSLEIIFLPNNSLVAVVKQWLLQLLCDHDRGWRPSGHGSRGLFPML